jgi:hypothetical protein
MRSKLLSGVTLAAVFIAATVIAGKPGASPSKDLPGTPQHPIVDSAMTSKEVFAGIDPSCPNRIIKRQQVITVLYYSFDRRIHRGQLVIDKSLAGDVKEVFTIALKAKFPIYSVIPISASRFRRHNRWDDQLSVAANNSSGFNYRRISGRGKLSNHAYGRAIDINPLQNPASGSSRKRINNIGLQGTLKPDGPVTDAFLRQGWAWGGRWKRHKDYQHFEKPRDK